MAEHLKIATPPAPADLQAVCNTATGILAGQPRRLVIERPCRQSYTISSVNACWSATRLYSASISSRPGANPYSAISAT